MKTKRPPRQVWLVLKEDGMFAEGKWTPVGDAVHTKAKDAKEWAIAGAKVVGPYVLAERVRQK